jgi:dissimilatory sulfite reductase (desulfoviridin) alpha/beta subunit
MKSYKLGTGLASAAAMLVMSGAAYAANPPAGSTGPAVAGGDTVHCYGVNSCKGTADCKTAAHDCKGMNSCKGQGFKAKTAQACIAEKGVIADLN